MIRTSCLLLVFLFTTWKTGIGQSENSVLQWPLDSPFSVRGQFGDSRGDIKFADGTTLDGVGFHWEIDIHRPVPDEDDLGVKAVIAGTKFQEIECSFMDGTPDAGNCQIITDIFISGVGTIGYWYGHLYPETPNFLDWRDFQPDVDIDQFSENGTSLCYGRGMRMKILRKKATTYLTIVLLRSRKAGLFQETLYTNPPMMSREDDSTFHLVAMSTMMTPILPI